MDIEFDPEKDRLNQARHGLSLAFGRQIMADADVLPLASFRAVDREERYKAIGRVDDKLYTAVFVLRDGRYRFISVRRSNEGERRIYERD